MSKLIKKMTGFKATDANMKCRGFQFELGVWYEHDGELDLCGSGFHFCKHPSGPRSYYTGESDRVFEVECEDVLDIPPTPGADCKLVCRKIRLVREVVCTDGRSNAGYGNTGDCNTGDCNTGDWNTGDWNTGDWNTGYCNTGDWNTGGWNACSFSAGFFCQEDPKVVSFDTQTSLTRNEFLLRFPESYELGGLLQQDDPIAFDRFKNIPGITPEKLNGLHNKFIQSRKDKNE
jgi:Pentapeptide repeats (8 copies)